MDNSNLTYDQIKGISANLNTYAKEMENILNEITQLVSKIGHEDVWGGTAALNSKSKFDSLNSKFESFYKAVTDESVHLNTVIENYQKVDKQISQ